MVDNILVDQVHRIQVLVIKLRGLHIIIPKALQVRAITAKSPRT